MIVIVVCPVCGRQIHAEHYVLVVHYNFKNRICLGSNKTLTELQKANKQSADSQEK